MDFQKIRKEQTIFIDKKLEEYLPLEKEYPEILFQAMRYSIFAGGKRLRPVFTLAACELFGGTKEVAAPFACALEMIHTYSLIHDDLPAMDNDDYRRGRLTSHKMFGEDIAILAGDALLSLAFELMTEVCCENPSLSHIKAMKAIAAGAGIRGMLGGQVVDVISEGEKIDQDTLDFIHKKKTAAMIQGALIAGAYLGGASDAEAEILSLAGEKIGIAFQIQDDILDVTSTKEVLGKPIHSDEKNKKVTYTTMYGIEKSKQFVYQLSQEAIDLFQSFGERSRFLIELTQALIGREY